MSKAVKKLMVEDWTAALRDVQDCVVVGYEGISAELARGLRSRLRRDRASLRVVRNSLAGKAFRAAGLEGLEALMAGPTAIAYGEDGVAVAKALADWAEEVGEAGKKLQIRGGALARKAITAEDVKALALLPDKKTMRAQVLAVAVAPAAQIATLLDATLAQVAYLVANHVEQKEKEGAAPASAAG